MIDFKLIDEAFQCDGFYSLQLEVGDKCYQGCNYCYMNALEEPENELSDKVIKDVLVTSQELGITAIEWLGGEPLLRSGVFELMEYASELGFRNNMWSGGLPFSDKGIVEKTAELCRTGLISFHLSTIDARLYEILHPDRTSRDIKLIIEGVKYLLEIGYPHDRILNTVTFTGMQSSDDLINTMKFFYEVYGIQTSINVYHTYLRPGYKKEDLMEFIPKPKEVAKIQSSYRKMINADTLPMNCVNKQYCSATLAVLNNGYVTPCATIREEIDNMNLKNNSFLNIIESNRDYLTFKYFKDINNLPADCKKCNLNDRCWGCRSRSYAIGDGMYGKDPRCFRSHNAN